MPTDVAGVKITFNPLPGTGGEPKTFIIPEGVGMTIAQAVDAADAAHDRGEMPKWSPPVSIRRHGTQEAEMLTTYDWVKVVLEDGDEIIVEDP